MAQGIFKRWRAACGIFSSKELLMLVYAAFNTYQRTLAFVARHFWWLLAFDAVLNVMWARAISCDVPTLLGFSAPLDPEKSEMVFVVGAFFLSKLALSFAVLLGVRASMEPKNWVYISMYFYKLGGFALLFLLLVGMVYIFPLSWLACLFYLDAKDTLKSVWPSILRALKMCWYFLPVAFTFFIIEGIFDEALTWMIAALVRSEIPWLIIGFIRFAAPFLTWVCLMSLLVNWYLKMKHSNYDLFSSVSRTETAP